MKTKKYFEINNKRIALLAMLLALNIICTLISQYVLANAGISQIAAFSITLWTIVVVYLSINGFYAVVFLIITEFIRMGLGQDLISTTALLLSDLTFLLVTIFVVYIVKLLTNKKVKEKKWFMLVALITGMVIGMIVATGMDLLYNWGFLLNWAGFQDLRRQTGTYVLLIWFNIANIAINIALVCVVFKPTEILTKKFQTSNTLQ